MKKQFAFLLLIPFISLSSCSFFTKIKSLFNKEEQEEVLEGLTDADNEWIEPNPENFNYVECEGGIKLTKYNFADDTPTIAVPQKINGKNVVGIAKDCFKRKKPLSRPIEENPDYDPNAPTFYIGDNIITVDENSFNFGATFFTSYAEKPESWEDNAISYYSAIDDRGNTYYSTTPKEIFVYKGVVYYEHRVLNAYFVAKCLTKQAEITIVPKIKGKSVITLGSSCFTGNSDLETINLPYTLVDLQAAAFSGCTNLKNINF